MHTHDGITKVAILAAGLIFLVCGAGWAYYGTDIFLATVMAGLAYCF